MIQMPKYKIDFTNYRRWINTAFLPLWNDTHRFKVIVGGAGSGKSVDRHFEKVKKLVAEPGHNIAIVRKNAVSHSISTIPLIRKCISDWNMGTIVREQKVLKQFTSLTNGNQIRFIGLDDLEKIKSITFDRGILTDVMVEEASEISEQDFLQLNLRLRGEASVPFSLELILNPISDTHWVKKKFIDDKSIYNDTNTTIHHSTYLDNRFLDKEYRESLERLKYEDEVYYNIYALGNWGSIGNLVFRNVVFQACPYSENDFDEVLLGQDFGFNHYNAIEKIGFKDGKKYSFAELYTRLKTNDEVIAENEETKILRKDQKCVADSAEPKSILDWQRAGYYIEPAKKGPDSVRQQIGYLNRGTWYIDPEKCPGLASEVKTYKWRTDKDGNPMDEPVKFKDDAIAACRYAIEEKTAESTTMFTPGVI
jgi:phage terminase large subunit